MKKPFYIIPFILFFFSCKPVIVNHEIKNATEFTIELGNIGIPGRSLLEYKFKTTAIPRIENKIRIEAQPTSFNKGKFNTYLKASPENKLGLVYIDSLESKPQFVELKIMDRVELIKNINNDTEVLNYLKTKQQNIKVVSSLSIALNNNNLNTITNAESVFLTYNENLKKCQIFAVNKNGEESIINFGDGTPFAYSVSSFCWHENQKKQVIIADIIDSWDSCPTKTYITATKAYKPEKKVNYFKL